MNSQQQAAQNAANTLADLAGMLEEVLQTQELTPECREEVNRCLRENYAKGTRGKLLQAMELED